jgi:altronate dehydratase
MRNTRRVPALVIHPRDNVAVVLYDLAPGTKVQMVVRGRRGDITVREHIPAYHKFALVPIRCGGRVVKYGEVIGQATANISSGAHVHVHNVQSRRVRPQAG